MEKSKFMMIVIIVLLVVLLGTVVGVSFYVLNVVKNQPEASSDGTVTGAQDRITKSLYIEEITTVSLGSAITTNLADSPNGEGHIAKVAVSVGYDNTQEKVSEDFAVTFGANTVVARAVALACIHKYTYEDLNTDDGPSMLADDIKKKLQEEFNTTLIVSVVFDEWLLQ